MGEQIRWVLPELRTGPQLAAHHLMDFEWETSRVLDGWRTEIGLRGASRIWGEGRRAERAVEAWLWSWCRWLKEAEVGGLSLATAAVALSD